MLELKVDETKLVGGGASGGGGGSTPGGGAMSPSNTQFNADGSKDAALGRGDASPGGRGGDKRIRPDKEQTDIN